MSVCDEVVCVTGCQVILGNERGKWEKQEEERKKVYREKRIEESHGSLEDE